MADEIEDLRSLLNGINNDDIMEKMSGDGIVIDQVTESAEAIITVPETPSVAENYVKKYLDKLDTVTNEVLTACRSDRQEAQEVIDIIRGKIASCGAGPISSTYVEGVVNAIEVKSKITTNTVKIMEANAKMIAATKAAVSINNNITSIGNDQDLEDILSGPAPEDF